MSLRASAAHAADILLRGGIIAYPTEAVWGLGCDPYNVDAIKRLCEIKQRPLNKGLVLVAGSVDQAQPWLQQLPEAKRKRVLTTWPGPVTWLLPNGGLLPDELTGGRVSVAIRVSAHPVVSALCQAFGGPIVSSSANVSGHAPLMSAIAVQRQFSKYIDQIVIGSLGEQQNPSMIYDALTEQQIR